MAKSAAKSSAASITAALRFLILCGPDRFLQDEYLRTLRESLSAKLGGEDAFDVVRFDGASGPSILSEIFDECRSFGLMQQHKIVLVENADLLLKQTEEEEAPAAPKPEPKAGAKGKAKRPMRAPQTPRELMESYAESPSDSATLVLRANTWRPGKLDKAVEALGGDGGRGAVLKCEELTFDRAIAWAMLRAPKRHNATIDRAAAAALITAVGSDLGRVDSELEKLATAAGGEGQPITAELVASLTMMTREDTMWSIQQAVLFRDAAGALTHLRELLDVARHDPVPLNWSMLDLARKLHAASRSLAAKENPYAVAGRLKLWGEQKDALMSAASRMSPAVAAGLLAAAVASDSGSKSGRGEPERNLELLTLRFSIALGKANA